MTSPARKRLKIIGLLSCLMMLALWIFSVMFASSYEPLCSQWSISLSFGRIVFDDDQTQNPGQKVRLHHSLWTCHSVYQQLKELAPQMPRTEFAQLFLGFSLPGKNGILPGMLHFPIWLLIVAVGIPTGILWWRDRRPKTGFCKACEYDLTGNVSGVCPECGTAVSPETG